ncbi:MAG: HD domain-containing protein [candidate division WOR-3 bacterium]|nr:HD domain-containing protein [candidate division WOR-3 bacterium]
MPEFRKIVQGGRSVGDEKIKSPEVVYENTLKYIENAYTLLAKGKGVPSPESILSEFIFILKTQGPEMVVLAHRPPSSPFISIHSVSVSIIAVCIGISRRLPGPSLEELEVASLFHCIGRSLKLEDDVLRDKDKFAQMKGEYIKSVEKLDLVSGMTSRIKKIVGEHHKRMGPEDYPTEKVSEGIELETRILIVADTYCSLILSPYSERRVHPHKALMRLLEKNNLPFDADILKTLIEVVGIYPVGTCVELNNGEIGRVIRPRFGFPMRPLIEVISSPTGERFSQPQTRDLIETPILHIRRVVKEEGER